MRKRVSPILALCLAVGVAAACGSNPTEASAPGLQKKVVSAKSVLNWGNCKAWGVDGGENGWYYTDTYPLFETNPVYDLYYVDEENYGYYTDIDSTLVHVDTVVNNVEMWKYDRIIIVNGHADTTLAHDENNNLIWWSYPVTFYYPVYDLNTVTGGKTYCGD